MSVRVTSASTKARGRLSRNRALAVGLGGFEELGVVSVVPLGAKSYRGKGEKRPAFRKKTGSDKTEISF